MKCPNCGREGTGSLERCTSCGTILTGALNTGFFPSVGDSPTYAGGAVATGSFAPTGGGYAAPPRSEVPDGPHGPLQPGEAFGHRYHIIRLLGMGGMGAVYQAWDSELGVAVAIKVVLPDADPEAAADVQRRFKRELLLARQVTHKNVVRIHDLGEIDDIKYITMSFVEGSDLATLLRKEGRLPAPRALSIARHIVDGLVAAHAEGIVHRDLKPANIMIDVSGDAVIMDFGIARSTTRASGPQQTAGPRVSATRGALHLNRTMVGTVVGTIPYMAPEQAGGQEVDQRADIYSFGLILYDMLAGDVRGRSTPSPIEELKARTLHAPASVRSLVPEVPEALDRVLTRCLAPNPDQRYKTTVDLAADLAKLDDKGEPLPFRRVVGARIVAAGGVAALVLLGATWWFGGRSTPVVEHAPVSVLIADLQNLTNDPEFDRALEPTLKRALEGAGFITAIDRSGITRTLGERPPEKLDEVSARELAVKQGLGVVLSGSINPQGNGFGISIKAAQTVTGNVIAETRGRASNKDQVVGVATRLMTTVRQALGDTMSESDQMFAMASLSATSLDVVRYYAAAQEAASNGKFDQARDNAAKAVELDPKFGIGYQLLAVASRNLGRLQDADNYADEALRHLDGMTERERYLTRGLFFRVKGDYQQCVKEYGDLIARYSADITGHNQHALCSSKLRNLQGAVDEMRQVVNILPKRVLFRVNLALYSNYAGDFQTGEQEALTIQEPDPYALLALAMAQLGQGQLTEASATYQKLSTVSRLGSSLAASGLGDIAVHEGRYQDAVRILEQGAAADLTAKDADRAAAKFAAAAYAQLLRRQNRAAIAFADKALENSKALTIRFLVSRIFIEAGEIDRAQGFISEFDKELQAEPQAYAKILAGEVALKKGDARGAIKLLLEANGLLDTWIGHFVLGRAYLEAGAFAQADSEFDRSLKRRGEAISLFLDEEPTYAYFPPVYYYQGRVREGLNLAGFADSYRAYLNLRGASNEDPLVPEARKRAGG